MHYGDIMIVNLYIFVLKGCLMKMVSRTFHLYRYQILPTVENFQSDFHTGITSKEELISKKNEIFANEVKGIKTHYHSRAELTHELYEAGNLIVIKLGANRSLVRITKDLEEEEIDN